jgi:hypothetical protein
MAFDKASFQPIGGQAKAGNAPQMWSYTAPAADAIADIDNTGYFNEVADLLKVGDMIYVWDSSVPTASQIVVLSNTGTVVDTGNATALTVTNT